MSLWSEHLGCRWPTVRVKDVVDLVNGHPFDSKFFSDECGTPLIRIRDVVRGFTKTFVMGEVPDEAWVRRGDLLVGMDGDFNSVLWNGPDSALNQRLCVLRAHPEALDQRFLAYFIGIPLRAINDVTFFTTVKHLSSADLLCERIPLPPLAQQRRVADFLDAELSNVEQLVAAKSRMLELLQERTDARIMELVGRSALAGESEIPTVPIKRQLVKLDRWASEGEMVTAFRDGQVTTRAIRGREGFADSWMDDARVQVVKRGDLVVHGLDGFSGAIGDVEVGGVCSPVYHVCHATDGDTAFLGRMLRLLAIQGYLTNFAISTRERAVDFRNWDLFGRIPIPMPSLEEQRRIGDEIRALRPLAKAIAETQVLAAERRRSLVLAAVTGEMEVP